MTSTRKRPGDDLPLWRKLGHAQMIEEIEIRQELRDAGWVDSIALYFEVKRRYEVRHANDTTFRQLCKARRTLSKPLYSDNGLMKYALEAIRDGYNDPRALAAKVLTDLEDGS